MYKQNGSLRWLFNDSSVSSCYSSMTMSSRSFIQEDTVSSVTLFSSLNFSASRFRIATRIFRSSSFASRKTSHWKKWCEKILEGVPYVSIVNILHWNDILSKVFSVSSGNFSHNFRLDLFAFVFALFEHFRCFGWKKTWNEDQCLDQIETNGIN